MKNPNIQLITAEGYDREFYKTLNSDDTMTQKKAFQIVENKYFETFGCSKYSSFDSYRVARNRRLKK